MNVGDRAVWPLVAPLWGNGLGLDRAGRYLYPFFPPSNAARAAMTKLVGGRSTWGSEVTSPDSSRRSRRVTSF